MIASALFERLFPTKGLNAGKYNLVAQRAKLIDALNRILPKYKIDSYLRVCAFLANCGIETDYFKTTTEYASGWDYDISVNPAKARSLGNFHQGDGPKFKGSGLSQTTGGFNFAALNPVIGKKLGIDFTKHPEKLREDIEIAVESACIFWDSHNLNKYADLGEFKELSGIVNRGDKNLTPLHWVKRNELYSLLKRRIPADFTFAPKVLISQPAQVAEADKDNSVVLTPTDNASTDEAKTPPSLKEIGSTVFLHTPKDTVKNILVVIGTRVFAGVSTVWYLGLHGQIFLIAVSVITAAAIVYACIKYAPRLLDWCKTAADYFAGN